MPYLSKLTKRLALIWTTALVLAGAGCTSVDADAITNPDVPVDSSTVVTDVRVLPDSTDLTVGSSLRLAVEVRNNRGQLLRAEDISWTSSDSSVARVAFDGTVLTLTEGSAEVRATSRGVLGKSRILSRRPPVATVTVSPSQNSLTVGEHLTLQAVARSAGDSVLMGRSIVWLTTSSAVATVDSLGRLTARAAGSATVTATIEGVVGSASLLVVVPAPVPVATVTVGPASSVLAIGGTTSLSASVRDAGGNVLTGRAVSWSSTSTGVATVSSGGVVTARAAGSATIQATSEGRTGSASVTVSAPAPVPVATVTLTPATGTLLVGQAMALVATVRDSNGVVLVGRSITWSSSSTAIATVTNAGSVTGVAAGSVTIRAVSEGRTGSASVTVSVPAPVPVATVTLTPATGTVVVGQAVALVATARDANGVVLVGRSVTWSSSSTAIAIVTNAGSVTGVAAGSVTITAVSEGRSGTASVLVSAPPPPPQGGGIVLSSQWNTGVGNTDNVLTDGGRWNGIGNCMLEGTNRVIGVVPGSEAGWTRTANIFRVTLHDVPPSPGCGQVEWINQLPASTTHWGRFYYRNDENSMTSMHNFSQNFGVADPGAIQWVFFNRHGVTNGWTMNIRPVHLGFQYPYNVWRPQTGPNAGTLLLSDDEWYRYEWMVEYVASNRMRIYPRLYNAAGALIADASTFYQQDTPATGTHTLASWYAAGNSFPVASTDLARNFGIGNEGRNPGTASGRWYIADFAISTGGWIGQQ